MIRFNSAILYFNIDQTCRLSCLCIILYQCIMASSANNPFFASSYSSDIRHVISMSAPHTLSIQRHQEPYPYSMHQDISASSSSHIGHAFNHVRIPVPVRYFFIHDMLPKTCLRSTRQEKAASSL